MKKIISLVVFAGLVSNEVLAAAVPVRSLPHEAIPSGDSIIPRSYGCITEFVVRPDSGGERQPIVINIQDLHCHPEVQRNIARILSSLDERYTLKRVYVEGGYGAISTSWLDAVNDQGTKERLIETLVDRGLLTGSERYAALAGKPDLLIGLEDEALHKENIVRLGKILKRKEAVIRYLDAMGEDLAALKTRYYRPRNRRFDALVAAYAAGKVQPRVYYRKLFRLADAVAANPSAFNALTSLSAADYPALAGYLELDGLSKGLNQARISRQLSEFVCFLKTDLPYEEYCTLLNPARRDGFDARLAAVAQRFEGAQGARFPDLYRYFAYLRKKQAVSPLAVIEEEKRLVGQLRLAFSGDIGELDVAFLSDFFSVFSDYLCLRLSADDYAYFRHRYDIFLRRWAKYASDARIRELAGDNELVRAFYEANIARNESFIRHIPELEGRERPAAEAGPREGGTVPALSETLRGAEIIVVVSGGFHARGLGDMLRRRGISYITITPNVTKGTAATDKIYDELALRQAANFSSQALALTLGSCDAKIVAARYGARHEIDAVTLRINGSTMDVPLAADAQGRWSVTGAWHDMVTADGVVLTREKIESAVREAVRLLSLLSADPEQAFHRAAGLFEQWAAGKGILQEGWRRDDQAVRPAAAAGANITQEQAARVLYYFQGIMKNGPVKTPMTAADSRILGGMIGRSMITDAVDEIFCAPFRELGDLSAVFEAYLSYRSGGNRLAFDMAVREFYLRHDGYAADTEEELVFKSGMENIMRSAFFMFRHVRPSWLRPLAVRSALVAGHGVYNIAQRLKGPGARRPAVSMTIRPSSGKAKPRQRAFAPIFPDERPPETAALFKQEYFSRQLEKNMVVLNALGELMDRSAFELVDRSENGNKPFRILDQKRIVPGTIFPERTGIAARTICLSRDITFAEMLGLVAALNAGEGEEDRSMRVEQIQDTIVYSAEYLEYVRSELGSDERYRELRAYLGTLADGLRSLVPARAGSITARGRLIAQAWLGIDDAWIAKLKRSLDKGSDERAARFLRLFIQNNHDRWERELSRQVSLPLRELYASILTAGSRQLEKIGSAEPHSILTLQAEIKKEMLSRGLNKRNGLTVQEQAALITIVEQSVHRYVNEALASYNSEETLNDNTALRKEAEKLGLPAKDLMQLKEVTIKDILADKHMLMLQNLLCASLLRQYGFTVYGAELLERRPLDEKKETFSFGTIDCYPFKGPNAGICILSDGSCYVVNPCGIAFSGPLPAEELNEQEITDNLGRAPSYVKRVKASFHGKDYVDIKIRVMDLENGVLGTVLNTAGAGCFAKKRYAEALALHKQVLALNPDFAAAWTRLGDDYFALRMIEEARFACQRATRIDPYTSAGRSDDRGFRLFNEGNYYQAVEALQKAWLLERTEGNTEFILDILCSIYEHLRQYENAVENRITKLKAMETTGNFIYYDEWRQLLTYYRSLHDYRRIEIAALYVTKNKPGHWELFWDELRGIYTKTKQYDKVAVVDEMLAVLSRSAGSYAAEKQQAKLDEMAAMYPFAADLKDFLFAEADTSPSAVFDILQGKKEPSVSLRRLLTPGERHTAIRERPEAPARVVVHACGHEDLEAAQSRYKNSEGFVHVFLTDGTGGTRVSGLDFPVECAMKDGQLVISGIRDFAADAPELLRWIYGTDTLNGDPGAARYVASVVRRNRKSAKELLSRPAIVVDHTRKDEGMKGVLSGLGMHTLPVAPVEAFSAYPAMDSDTVLRMLLKTDAALSYTFARGKILHADAADLDAFVRSIALCTGQGYGQIALDWDVFEKAGIDKKRIVEIIALARSKGISLYIRYTARPAAMNAVMLDRIAGFGCAGILLDVRPLDRDDAETLLSRLSHYPITGVVARDPLPSETNLKACREVPITITRDARGAPEVRAGDARGVKIDDMIDIRIAKAEGERFTPGEMEEINRRITEILCSLPLSHTMLFHTADLAWLMEDDRDILSLRAFAFFGASFRFAKKTLSPEKVRRLGYGWDIKDLVSLVSTPEGMRLHKELKNGRLPELSTVSIENYEVVFAIREQCRALAEQEQAQGMEDGALQRMFIEGIAGKACIIERVYLILLREYSDSYDGKNQGLVQFARDFLAAKTSIDNPAYEEMLGEVLLARAKIRQKSAKDGDRIDYRVNKDLREDAGSFMARLYGEAVNTADAAAQERSATAFIDAMMDMTIADYRLRKNVVKRYDDFSLAATREIMKAM